MVHYADDTRALLEESSLAKQKAFIRTFAREVVVKSKEKAVLRCTLPLPPGGFGPDGGPARIRTWDQSVMSRPLCR